MVVDGRSKHKQHSSVEKLYITIGVGGGDWKGRGGAAGESISFGQFLKTNNRLS